MFAPLLLRARLCTARAVPTSNVVTSMRIATRFCTALLLLGGCASAGAQGAAPPPVRDAESLVRAMQARYDGRWYRTLSFSQVVTRPGQPDETWDEWGGMPGRLRIEQGNGRGAIFANDSTYVIRGDSVARRIAGRNDLMTLGFDVYTQDPARTLATLREDGFDLTRFRMDTWQGRPAYVVGASSAADSLSKQFWIDAERLLFVRLLEPIPNQAGKAQDVRFNAYQPAGRAWIAPEVEVVVDGQVVFKEVYSNIQVDIPLDPSLWQPDRWKTAVKP
jgi:hypothetical protein